MNTRRSRRWFVAAVSGVAAAAASTTMVWRNRRSATASGQTAHRADSLGYVDHNGWMVTPADQERLRRGVAAADTAALRSGSGAKGEQ